MHAENFQFSVYVIHTTTLDLLYMEGQTFTFISEYSIHSVTISDKELECCFYNIDSNKVKESPKGVLKNSCPEPFEKFPRKQCWQRLIFRRLQA